MFKLNKCKKKNTKKCNNYTSLNFIDIYTVYQDYKVTTYPLFKNVSNSTKHQTFDIKVNNNTKWINYFKNTFIIILITKPLNKLSTSSERLKTKFKLIKNNTIIFKMLS